MTETPPVPPSQEKPKKSNVGKYIAIGCGGLLVLAIVGGYLAYRGVKGVIARVADQYTATEPAVLPELEVTEAEAAATLERVNAFTEGLAADGAVAPLTLTSRDINTLIERHPDWSELAGKVHVSIEDDRIHGQTSIPLGEITSMLEGRYLNALATFRLELSAGRLAVYIDSAEVAGQALPDEFMNAVRTENLAQEANQDPEMAAILDKFESITVQDGALVIVPKASP